MLRTNFADDVFTGDRKYNMINNPDGTVSFVDVTEYQTEGDVFGAQEVNEITGNVNKKAESKTLTLIAENWVGAAAPYTQEITVDSVTDDQMPIIGWSSNATRDQRWDFADAAIDAVTSTGKITFTAKGYVPTNNIPINVLLIRPEVIS